MVNKIVSILNKAIRGFSIVGLCLIGFCTSLEAKELLSSKPIVTSPPMSPSASKVRIVPDSEYDVGSHNYFSELLTLSLKKTEAEYGVTSLEEIQQHLVQQRALQQLHKQGVIDVYWTVTSRQRENDAIVVRIPLLKGIMGYRVALIRADRVEDFSRIDSDLKLKELIAGQGHDWPDFEILSDNGFEVLGTSVYDSLINLLYKGRIDYYPRAINETMAEYVFFDNPELAIEPRFVLHYPSYIFFFVSKDKPELAKRIELGLNRAIEDGSFDKIFFDYINLDEIKAELNLNNRKLIKLKNPLLPEKTASIELPSLIGLKPNKN